MVAAASQGTAVENENLIRLADAGDALGDDKDRCIVQLVQGLAQSGVCCVVQRAGAVVQDQELRLPDKGPGNGQPLLLPPGEVPAALFQNEIQAAGLVLDGLAGLGDGQGLPESLIGGVLVAPAEVVPDRAGKQGRLLGHDGDLAAERGPVIATEILPPE